MKLDNLLIKASQVGATWLVSELLAGGKVEPKANNSEALRWAAEYGHIEIVKLLLPVSEPKAYDSYALRCAAQNGYLEVAQVIQNYIDTNL